MAEIGLIRLEPLTPSQPFTGTAATDDFLTFDLGNLDYSRTWFFGVDQSGALTLGIWSLKPNAFSTYTLPSLSSANAIEQIKIVNAGGGIDRSFLLKAPGDYRQENADYWIHSTSGNDILYAPATSARNTLWGGAGDDKLFGSSSVSGFNTFWGGPGNNEFTGGSGTDVFRALIRDNGRDTIVDTGGGIDRVEVHFSNYDQRWERGLNFLKSGNDLVGSITEGNDTYTFTVKNQYGVGESLDLVRFYLPADPNNRYDTNPFGFWFTTGDNRPNLAEAGTDAGDTFSPSLSPSVIAYRAYGNKGNDTLIRPDSIDLFVRFFGGEGIDTIQLPKAKAQYFLRGINSNDGFDFLLEGTENVQGKRTHFRDVEIFKFTDATVRLSDLVVKEILFDGDLASLYRAESNALVISASDRPVGGFMALNSAVLTAGTKLYASKTNPSAVLDYGDANSLGKFGLVFAAGAAITEQRFDSAGNALGKAAKLSLTALLEKELAFGTDLNSDGLIGDTVTRNADTDGYQGSGPLKSIYNTGKGFWAIDQAGLAQGAGLTASAKFIFAGKKAFALKAGQEILGLAKKDSGNFEFLIKTGASVSAQTVSSETGLLIGKAVKFKAGSSDLSKREYFYRIDLDGQGSIDIVGAGSPPTGWDTI